tara:strand:+ start:1831 stop:2496 length:666 start_codon:yes stop_codon:yes gene_type:complete
MAVFTDSEEAKLYKELLPDMEQSWRTRQIYRTEPEMRFSVLNDGKHPTPAAKYWQAVREQYGMFTSIESLRFDYRESQIELLEIQRAIDETTDQIHVMRLEVRRDRENYKLASMYAEASDRLREVALWARLKAEALEADPNINVEDVSEHQWETMHRVLLNRQASIGAGSGQAEIINVRGPLLTMDRARAYGADLKNWWAGVEEEQKAAIEAKAAEKQADS